MIQTFAITRPTLLNGQDLSKLSESELLNHLNSINASAKLLAETVSADSAYFKKQNNALEAAKGEVMAELNKRVKE